MVLFTELHVMTDGDSQTSSSTRGGARELFQFISKSYYGYSFLQIHLFPPGTKVNRHGHLVNNHLPPCDFSGARKSG